MAKDINKVLVQLMDEMDLRLVDFKVEFGKTSDGKILLVMKFLQIHVVFGINILILTLIKTSIAMIQVHLLTHIQHFK